MPGSMPEQKDFILTFVHEQLGTIKRILDVGPGSGNYFDLLNCRGEYTNWGPPDLFLDPEWIAVEIYEPYISMFKLYDKYNNIFVRDIYDVDWNNLGFFDIIFLGDVLEHMPKERGQKVIREAVNHSRYVIISLPIVDYPQEACYGNIYEKHVEQYSPSKMMDLLQGYEIIAQREGEIIGAYIIRNYI